MPTNAQTILVVGGAGYIGSHLVLALEQAGFYPVVLDNLSTGHRDAVVNAPLIVGEMGNAALLTQLFSTYHFTAVMHLAALIDVAESMEFPEKYYQNNVAATFTLLEVMSKYQVKKIIFSSTAAVYGHPSYTPIDEAHTLAPINPYGQSKVMAEQLLKDDARSQGLNYAILRYFNAAGADPYGRLGERRARESHLIPLVLQAAARKRPHVTVYGRDYSTIDGTCVRDYVHVTDICTAHLLALQALREGEATLCCNLGTGQGYSVQQVIDAASRVTRQKFSVIDSARRLGDPAILVANATLAQKQLNWQPKYTALETIIQHAWQFMQA